ncbi:hypothetical protein [Corynebacterium kalidii]|jgi:hypothetical protein
MSTLRDRTGRTGAAAAAAAAVLLLTGCVIGEVDRPGETTAAGTAGTTSSIAGGTAPSPTTTAPDAPGAGADIDVAETGGSVGVALLDDGALRTGGSLADLADAAWSTSKVPLSIAALNAAPGDDALVGQMRQAITVSDNAAAEALWGSLGDPGQAAAAVQDVLRAGGDTTTTVPAERRRAEFSVFGQTTWTLDDQVTFAAGLRCIPGSEPVLEAMGQVSPAQSSGLGQFDGARFKGGWGPDTDGTYLLRQFGLVPAEDGTTVPVAVAVTADDGTYESAQRVLDAAVTSVRDTVTGAHGEAADGDC